MLVIGHLDVQGVCAGPPTLGRFLPAPPGSVCVLRDGTCGNNIPDPLCTLRTGGRAWRHHTWETWLRRCGDLAGPAGTWLDLLCYRAETGQVPGPALSATEWSSRARCRGGALCGTCFWVGPRCGVALSGHSAGDIFRALAFERPGRLAWPAAGRRHQRGSVEETWLLHLPDTGLAHRGQGLSVPRATSPHQPQPQVQKLHLAPSCAPPTPLPAGRLLTSPPEPGPAF